MIPMLPKGFTHPMLIGEGAFSTVYRVRQTSLDRWVAIKIISEKDDTRRTTLLKEARTQANIHLECIPQIYDAFEWKKRICIIMQWLKGATLREILDQKPPANNRFKIADSLILAISNLHAQGYAHRDIKPENIFISPDNGVFLLDFGFTKNVIDGNKSMAGVIRGTPAYMAPELWNSDDPVDPIKTDMYSLGRILKELFPDDRTNHVFINQLLDDFPLKRPQSLRLYYEQWHQVNALVSNLVSWKQITGSISGVQLSRKLLAAAKELYYAHRVEEAYWLIVECMEEDPDYTDALDFMQNFSQTTRKKIFNNHYYIAAGVFIVLLAIGAYLAGKSTQKKEITVTVSPQSSNTVNPQFLTLNTSEQNVVSTSFLLDTNKTSNLKGNITIKNFPQNGLLFLDDSLLSIINTSNDRFDCLYGTHLIKWIDTDSTIKWKERFFILPFQSKIFDLQKKVLPK
jgi:serine/threonine protein kinase